MKCGFCQSSISKQLNLEDLLSLKRIVKNECCESCFIEIEKRDSKQSSCQYCKKILVSKGDTCLDCQTWRIKNEKFNLKHNYLYLYNEKMKEYFQQYKFIGDIRMSRIFSGDVHEKLLTYQKQGFIIVPIPISDKRLKERGFNQVEKLLEASLISYEPLLKKKENDVIQSEKNKEERLLMQQPFFIKSKNKQIINQKKVLLVDDVYTTGRTILHAYDSILMNNPNEIRSFSLSR